jgi:hypothetical protein
MRFVKKLGRLAKSSNSHSFSNVFMRPIRTSTVVVYRTIESNNKGIRVSSQRGIEGSSPSTVSPSHRPEAAPRATGGNRASSRPTARLREHARAAIRHGLLPKHEPRSMWGGPGSGLPCPLCAEPIRSDEIEFEVEFDPPTGAQDGASASSVNGRAANGAVEEGAEVNGWQANGAGVNGRELNGGQSDGRDADGSVEDGANVHHFHLRCFEAWQLERRTPEVEARALNVNGHRAEEL